MQHTRAPTPCELSEHARREPVDAAPAAHSAEGNVSEQRVPGVEEASQARVPSIEESSRIAGSQLDAGSQGTSNEDRCIIIAATVGVCQQLLCFAAPSQLQMPCMHACMLATSHLACTLLCCILLCFAQHAHCMLTQQVSPLHNRHCMSKHSISSILHTDSVGLRWLFLCGVMKERLSYIFGFLSDGRLTGAHGLAFLWTNV